MGSLRLFSQLSNSLPIALIALLVGSGSLHAWVRIPRVEPSAADPAIRTVHGTNIAMYDPQVPSRHRLFFVLVATQGVPAGSWRMDSIIATWCYHAISIDYEDNVIAVACTHSLDSTAFRRYRDSILNRFQKLLVYPVKYDPKGGWGQFVKDSKPVWRHIFVAGHSQGAGHAPYIGRLFRVERGLMFSDPQDYMANLHQPAPGLGMKSATPPSSFFAFLAMKDPFNVHHKITNCMVLMHLSKPDTLIVKSGEVIRGYHQVLINDFPARTPHVFILFPRFVNVWKYLLTFNDIGGFKDEFCQIVLCNHGRTSISFAECRISAKQCGQVFAFKSLFE